MKQDKGKTKQTCPEFELKPRQVNDSSQSNQGTDHLVSHTFSVCVTDLAAGWGPMTLIRDMPGVRASLITNKSETCFILGRHRFSCRLGSL
jgi:hypothetical protein